MLKLLFFFFFLFFPHGVATVTEHGFIVVLSLSMRSYQNHCYYLSSLIDPLP